MLMSEADVMTLHSVTCTKKDADIEDGKFVKENIHILFLNISVFSD